MSSQKDGREEEEKIRQMMTEWKEKMTDERIQPKAEKFLITAKATN